MTYATLDHLLDRYGSGLLLQLTDRGELATGRIDTDIVERALLDTDAAINARLGRYQFPLSEVPELLVDLAQSIAIYKLHRFKPDPKIEADYAEAMRTLRGISTGEVTLSIAGAEVPGTAGNGVRITDRERPLTAENLKGFI